jgi:hypothetical protein
VSAFLFYIRSLFFDLPPNADFSVSCISVKPDATQEEIRAAYDDSQGGAQIFSQAVRQFHLTLSAVHHIEANE